MPEKFAEHQNVGGTSKIEGITNMLSSLSTGVTKSMEKVNEIVKPSVTVARDFFMKNSLIMGMAGFVPGMSEKLESFIAWTDKVIGNAKSAANSQQHELLEAAKNGMTQGFQNPDVAPAIWNGEIHLDPSKLQISPDSKKHWQKIEQGLNKVAKDLNVNAAALFAVIMSESRFDTGAKEVGGYGGKGLLQFTGGTQALLNGDWSLESQINAIKKYFSGNLQNLQNMKTGRDLKLLTRWGVQKNLAQAREAKQAPDFAHFNRAWKEVQDAIIKTA